MSKAISKPTWEQVKKEAFRLGIKKKVAKSFWLHHESRSWKGVLDFIPLLRRWNMKINREGQHEKKHRFQLVALCFPQKYN